VADLGSLTIKDEGSHYREAENLHAARRHQEGGIQRRDVAATLHHLDGIGGSFRQSFLAQDTTAQPANSEAIFHEPGFAPNNFQR
jgi:hypothetical protein